MRSRVATIVAAFAALAALAAAWLVFSREPSRPAANERAPAAARPAALPHHERCLRDVQRARVLRLTGEATATAPSSAPARDPVGTLGDDYVEASLAQIASPLGRCRDAALARAPELEGTLVLALDLAAEPGVGGVVERCELAEGALTPARAALVACACAALRQLELPQPRVGGRVRVAYPLVLASGG